MTDATNATLSARTRARAKPRREWQPAFLKGFEQSGTVKGGCEAAGVAASTAYRARQRDERFALAWADLEQSVTMHLESRAVELAIAGEVRLIEFLLKARKPETYRDRHLVEHEIRHNPTVGAALPQRDEHRRIAQGDDDLEEQDVRALTTEQLATLLAVAPVRHRLLLSLLAATGLRIGEALALRWGDLALDGERPVVRVRRSLRHGRFKPPKSKYGRRSVPIDFELVRDLRAAHALTEYPGERDLVFCTGNGAPLDYSNLRRRALLPAAQEAGVPWAGFHSLRHTCASRLFAAGRNAVQVQRWLGHHSPAFTLARYVHLMDGDLGTPLALPGVSAGVSTPTGYSPQPPETLTAETPETTGPRELSRTGP